MNTIEIPKDEIKVAVMITDILLIGLMLPWFLADYLIELENIGEYKFDKKRKLNSAERIANQVSKQAEFYITKRHNDKDKTRKLSKSFGDVFDKMVEFLQSHIMMEGIDRPLTYLKTVEVYYNECMASIKKNPMSRKWDLSQLDFLNGINKVARIIELEDAKPSFMPILKQGLDKLIKQQ